MPALTVLLCLIVSVADGDTLTARCPTEDAAHPWQQVRVRLAEIDAPELGQPFGRRSKQHLATQCMHAQAIIIPMDTDRYGRTVARVNCHERDASMAMVRAGLAWAYTEYLSEPRIASAEQAARRARTGLWADLDSRTPPVAPWLWRQNPPAPVPDANGCFTGPRGGRYRITPSGRKQYGCDPAPE